MANPKISNVIPLIREEGLPARGPQRGRAWITGELSSEIGYSELPIG